jgi:tetratricopeptide (TPR) repeat protein
MRKSRPRRRGYICIWGKTNRETVTDSEGVVIDCPGCRQKSRMIGKSMRPYCSVFYIPLFPEGQGQPFIQCTHCGGKYNGDAAEIRERLASEMAQVNAAIVEKMHLYEADPANADLGCEIAGLLVQSDRMDEALKLARCLIQSHPENANACVLLGHLYWHRNELDDAIQAFRQAVDRNPSHAGAHFVLAAALMNANPPQPGEALALAKKAADYGHPEARNLMQTIEQTQRR